MILTKLNTHFQRFNFANILSSFAKILSEKIGSLKTIKSYKITKFWIRQKNFKNLKFWNWRQNFKWPSVYKVKFVSQSWVSISNLIHSNCGFSFTCGFRQQREEGNWQNRMNRFSDKKLSLWIVHGTPSMGVT